MDASAVDEDELQQSMGVSDSDDTTGPDSSSGRTADSLNGHVSKQLVGTIGEEGEEEQLDVTAMSSGSSESPTRVNHKQAVQGSGRTNKQKKRKPRASAGVPAMGSGGENYDSMRTELDLAQRLSRLDPDDDTSPFEMAQKLVQSCNDLQAIDGAESDTDTTESL